MDGRELSGRDVSHPDRLAGPRVAVMFHRLGPYHHARLREAAHVLDVTAVEYSEIDRTYEWEAVARSSEFHHVTLFGERDFDGEPILSVLQRIARVLGDLEPDVVAVPGWSGRGALATLAWCALTRTPAIVMSASTAWDEVRVAWKEAVKRQILRLSSAALAGGQPQLEYLAELGLPRDRIFVGYDVVDNRHFASGADLARKAGAGLRTRLGLPPRYFLASGRFVPKKNFQRLLTAYAAYRRRSGPEGWSLVLLGNGPGRGEIEALLQELKICDDVVMPGFKQYDDLPAYYGLADAFVHASTSEQWGLVVNEAMAAGLPVLVSRCCGCVEDLVEDGRNGFSFDPENVSELTDLMLYIASPQCDRAAMGMSGRRIVDRWSPAAFANGLLRATSKALELRGEAVAGFRRSQVRSPS